MDWLRVKTDQQLLEYRPTIDKLIADTKKARSTQALDPAQVGFIAEYLYRAAGFDRGLEYINALNCEKPEETFYFSKVEYLLEHARTNGLEASIQELFRRQTETAGNSTSELSH